MKTPPPPSLQNTRFSIDQEQLTLLDWISFTYRGRKNSETPSRRIPSWPSRRFPIPAWKHNSERQYKRSGTWIGKVRQTIEYQILSDTGSRLIQAEVDVNSLPTACVVPSQRPTLFSACPQTGHHMPAWLNTWRRWHLAPPRRGLPEAENGARRHSEATDDNYTWGHHLAPASGCLGRVDFLE